MEHKVTQREESGQITQTVALETQIYTEKVRCVQQRMHNILITK